MEKFIVSARKYRPSTFDTVVGQLSITTTLKNAIKNNHLAQAFLFCGPRGVGKTTCARILAKTINCNNLTPSVEACDQCESCVSFNNQQSLNIYELDAASNNSVDDIRALVEQVRFAPHSGKYKIYIIDEVHMLSASAFNAFLKTLEEPPSYAIFILATTEKHKILPTILSRCQIFDFSRIQIEDIAGHLANVAAKEGIQADPDALHIIAQKADGALRDSLSMFDQIVSYTGGAVTYKAVIENLNILDYDYYFRVTDMILGHDISGTLLLFDQILSSGFDGHNFINGLSSHFRDLLVCKDEATLRLLEVSASIREKYRDQSSRCSPSFLLGSLDITNKCDVSYKSVKNQRLEPVKDLLRDEPGEKPAEVHENPKPYTASFKKDLPTGLKPVSISGILSGKSEKKDVPASESHIPPQTGENKFSSQDFESAWKEMAERVKAEGKMQLYSTLIRRNPEIQGNQVKLVIDNKVQQEELVFEKGNILGFLREKLKNHLLQLDIEISAQEEKSSTPYTDIDKFRRMAEKNPNLLELKNNLGLDFDYNY
jgi:DNA polymerase III subunit gamma/tau